MPTTPDECPHADVTWVIDRLGVMTNAGARIEAQHWECTTCHTHVPRPTNHTEEDHD